MEAGEDPIAPEALQPQVHTKGVAEATLWATNSITRAAVDWTHQEVPQGSIIQAGEVQTLPQLTRCLQRGFHLVVLQPLEHLEYQVHSMAMGSHPTHRDALPAAAVLARPARCSRQPAVL